MKQSDIWLINLEERFVIKLGVISDTVLEEIKIGLAKVLSIEMG